MPYQQLFNRLWEDYSKDNSQVLPIYQLFVDRGETVVNDHIALRTFNDPRVNIDVLAKPFLDEGYRRCGEYDFEVKKLKAFHFEHDDPEAPKVFISELLTEQFSDTVQNTIKAALDELPTMSPTELLFSMRPWAPISHSLYEEIKAESEYAAWMLAYGFRANHFTVLVNALNTFKSLADLNSTLQDNGFVLNDSGGLIKGSPEDLLEQSSTIASSKRVEFSDGEYEVPCCYYEFAKRYPKPDGQLYSGFVAASADKIFESTDKAQS